VGRESMMDGPQAQLLVKEETYIVRSAEGEETIWPRREAERADTLKHWIEEVGGEGAFDTPLPAAGLRHLLAACAALGEAPSRRIVEIEGRLTIEERSCLSSLDLNETMQVLEAANFLQAVEIGKQVSRYVCILLSGKDVEELRAALGAADDLSADEQAAALNEVVFTPPGASLAAHAAAPNEDVLGAVLLEADEALLCRLKAVSRAWRERARSVLSSRSACSRYGQRAPASFDEIVDLDVEVLLAAGRLHDAAAAARQLPGLCTLRGWGHKVNVAAVREQLLPEDAPGHDDDVYTRFDCSDDDSDEDLGGGVLRGCITGEGQPPVPLLVAAVASAGQGTVWGIPVQSLRENEGFISLSLSACRLGPVGAQLLGCLLPGATTLLSLDLPENGLDEEAARYLSEALAVNTSLTSLDLRDNHLGAQGATSFAKVLRTNRTLRMLDLASNYLTNGGGDMSGVIELAEALKQNSSLVSLNVRENDLSHDEGAKCLTEALAINQSLISLDLESTALKVESMKAIGHALQINTTLTTLSVRGNKVCVEGAKGFSMALAVNRSLTTLNMRYCGLDDNAVTHLLEGLKSNPSLHTLDLRGNCFNDAAKKALREAAAGRVTVWVEGHLTLATTL